MHFFFSSDYTEPSVLLQSEETLRQGMREYRALCREGDRLLEEATETARLLRSLITDSQELRTPASSLSLALADSLARAKEDLEAILSAQEEYYELYESKADALADRRARLYGGRYV